MSNENVVNDFKIFLNALPVQPDKDYYCNPIYLPLFDAAKYGDSSASFYDQLYPTIEAGVLTTLKRLAGEGPVLDLGIGTGRVGIPLSQSGIELHGIEASPAMIAALRKHTGGTDIHVIQGDFATTPLGGPYQLVYSLVSTFLLLPTLEQQKECFKNIAAHLKKDGCFVSEVYESESSFPEPDSTKIPIITKTGTEEYHVIYLATPVKLLDAMAAEAGLKLIVRWSDWRQKPYTEGMPRHISMYTHDIAG